MATYPPPSETLPIFDAGVFTTNDSTLTISQADKRYLKFPVGQGTETIPTLVVSGQATIGTATIDSIVIKQPTGLNNIVVGLNSLTNSTSASYDNVAFGRNIATGVLTGNNNTFLGSGGFSFITSATNNTSVGANNGIALTTGNDNTLIGKDAMIGLTTGSKNIGIGSGANITGNPTNCTIIGADATCASFTKSTAIGKDATATASNQVVLGTSTESVVIPNQIQFNYTSNPTISTTSLGYFVNTNGVSNITTINTDITIYSVTPPVGVYIFTINGTLRDPTSTGVLATNVYLRKAGTTQAQVIKGWGSSGSGSLESPYSITYPVSVTGSQVVSYVGRSSVNIDVYYYISYIRIA